MQGIRSTHKNQMCFYTCNEQSEKETKETIPLIIASKRIKYPRINLTKEVNDLYTEKYKTLLKEIKENINTVKGIHIHGLMT